MTEFTWKNDEFEIDGVILSAELEITLNWSWCDGEPAHFTALHVSHNDRTAPGWIGLAAMAWVAQNQATLLKAFQNRPELYWDECDDAWQRQMRSLAPSRATHL